MYFLAILTASLMAFPGTLGAPTDPKALTDEDGLPTLRLSRGEVDDLKRAAVHLPGHVHSYVNLGKRSIPMVEADPEMFLDDEVGAQRRALAPRGSCFRIPSIRNSCYISMLSSIFGLFFLLECSKRAWWSQNA